jgi:transglutaminase-like putative cysteine protease
MKQTAMRFKHKTILKFPFAGIFSLLMLLQAPALQAGSGNLSARNIPENLTTNANAVLRELNTTVEVKSLRNATIKEKSVITILNEAGKNYGHFYGLYYQNQKFRSITAEVFDQDGNRIRRLRRSDIDDRSYVSGISMFEETRLKTFEVHHAVYPYTVVLEYEIDYQGFVGFPRWVPQKSEDISVQQAHLTLIYPVGNPVKFNAMNLAEPEKSSLSGDFIRYDWQIRDLEAFRYEPLSVPVHEYLPVVYLSPNDFYFHASTGNLQTWSGYGDWVAGLLQERQDLPESVVSEINKLTEDVADNPRMMAKRIYKFMQSQTRYVSIQLGIGGFQPFPASMVANTGYGDCKALSNYTMAMLQAVGIESYYTEIGAGRRYIHFADFPSLDQTDHAILCVPFDNDTVWLECTSQRYPFGYVPASLQYRKALVVAEGGSKLVKMPSMSAHENLMELMMEIAVESSGNAEATVQTTYRGIQVESVFPEVWQSRKEQLEAIGSRYAIPGTSIQDFGMWLFDEDEIFANENLTLSINNLAAKTGSRLFLNAYPFSPLSRRFNKIADRKTDFQVRYPYTDKANFRFAFPDHLVIENLPDEVFLDTPFGSYKMIVSAEESTIVVERELTIYNGRYPAGEYNDYVDFRQAIFRADRNQIVLVEK